VNVIDPLAFRLLLQPIASAPQSALEPGGPAAARIGELWNLMLWIGTVVTLLTFAALAFALFRPRRTEIPEADRSPDPRGEQSNDEAGGRGSEDKGHPFSERVGIRAMIGAGIVFPALILGVIQLLTMRTLNAVAMPSHSVESADAPPRSDELAVLVTGLQFWWRVEYLDVDPARRFETANEIRIPVGKPVTIRLRSDDVIHSFWVPGLHGKMDLVPGRTNAISIRADSAGTWRGQCAEFCGSQHTQMAFMVVALNEADWNAWTAHQRLPAKAPVDSVSRANADVFLASGCVLCHSVRGTPARARAGPDLTHVASRLTLAAGSLPNTVGHRYGWIANPQAIKPGSAMPAITMTAAELHAIVRYLGTLE
jgi:cytochrome c oxidase subunit 2